MFSHFSLDFSMSNKLSVITMGKYFAFLLDGIFFLVHLEVKLFVGLQI